MSFKLILTDLQEDLVEQFKIYFKEFPEVEIRNGKFEDVDFDCVVSAANSFGMMDGGIDGAISGYFGWHVMQRVHSVLIEEYCGDQPIGTSFIVLANKEPLLQGNKYVAHTPTMTIPMDIIGTDNAYRAMRAMLVCVRNHNKKYDSIKLQIDAKLINENNLLGLSRINTVVCAGLGTFTGSLPFEKAAKQMALAYKHFIKPVPYIDWSFARYRTEEIFSVK